MEEIQTPVIRFLSHVILHQVIIISKIIRKCSEADLKESAGYVWETSFQDSPSPRLLPSVSSSVLSLVLAFLWQLSGTAGSSPSRT